MTLSSDNRPSIDQLFSDLVGTQKKNAKQYPPTHLWNPQKSGDMDLVIDREGRWIHEGREIKRPQIVKLFSTILKFEEGHYFLVTPVEKWQIQVDIAPFFIIQAKREIRDSEQAIILTTNTDDLIILSDLHPLKIDQGKDGNPIPLVKVREKLMGLISRPVYYQLIDWSEEISVSGSNNCLTLNSMGATFNLGQFD